MNRLILKELTDTYVVYYYRPENKGSCGEIRMNFDDEEATIVSRPTDDDPGISYAFHAMTAVKRQVKERNFLPAFTQAWY